MQEIFAKIKERLEEQQEEYIKDYDRYGNGEDYRISLIYERAIKIVNQVAEEYNGGWIPVSEMLPIENIKVWITYKIGASIYVGRDRVVSGKWYRTNKNAILAWKYMKVPEPYKPKGEK